MSTLGQEVMDAAETPASTPVRSFSRRRHPDHPADEGVAGRRAIQRVMGIVNGTTNFILTRMSETGGSFPEALEEAERLGYTELDPRGHQRLMPAR